MCTLDSVYALFLHCKKIGLVSDFPRDRQRLGAVEINDLYDNVIHSAMECALSAYLANERDKGLRREFGEQETNKNFLQEECLRLKARASKIKNTMKETLESVDKLQTDLDEANAAKLALENRAKS